MHVTYLDQLAAGGAAILAGAVNALAGGGTLITFPTLVGLGFSATSSNVTNTVSLLPGYLGGAWSQRDDLAPQLETSKVLALVAAVGGLAGSILLVVLPEKDFRVAVPYLILVACGLLGFGDRLKPSRPAVPPPEPDSSEIHTSHPIGLVVAVLLGSVYGGFFGAGLGIMFLALLGLFLSDSLTKLNALKLALNFVANFVAAVFFLFSGKVAWQIVPIMAVGSVVGGLAGGRLVRVIDPKRLRLLVVLAGVGVAISLWVS